MNVVRECALILFVRTFYAQGGDFDFDGVICDSKCCIIVH